MRRKSLLVSFLCLFSYCRMSWTQEVRPFLFRTSPFKNIGVINEVYNVGINDTIAVFSNNPKIEVIDSLEIWSENRASGSIVNFTLLDYFSGHINISFNLGTNAKPINQNIFRLSQTKSFEKLENGIRPGGKSFIYGFKIDHCLECKPKELGSIQEPLQFKIIFHHSNIGDTLLVIADLEHSLSIQSRIIPSSINQIKRSNLFNALLGRRTKMPKLHSHYYLAF